MMLGVMWMFQIIAFGLVSLRLYARLNVVQTYGWDDHFFNAAVVCSLFPQPSRPHNRRPAGQPCAEDGYGF